MLTIDLAFALALGALLPVVVRLRRLTALLAVVLGEFFFIVVPCYQIARNDGVAYYGTRQYSFTVANEAFALSLLLFFELWAVLMLAAALYRNRPYWTPPEPVRPDARLRAVLAVSILPVGVYFYLLGQIPLLEAVKELALNGPSAALLNKYRLEQTRYLSGGGRYFGQGYFLDWFTNVMPLVLIYAVVRVRMKRAVKWALLALPLVVQLGTGKRWPFMIVALTYLVVYAQLSGIRLRAVAVKPKVIATVGVVLLVGAVISYLQMRFDPTTSVADNLRLALAEYVGRFTATAGIAFNTAIQHFPESYQFRYGTTWLRDLQAILPGPGEPFALEFYAIQNGTYGFTASPTLFGSFYVNFGVVGACIITIGMAIGLAVMDRWFGGGRTTLERVTYALVIVATFYAVQGDVASLVNIMLEILLGYLICRLMIKSPQRKAGPGRGWRRADAGLRVRRSLVGAEAAFSP